MIDIFSYIGSIRFDELAFFLSIREYALYNTGDSQYRYSECILPKFKTFFPSYVQ